MSECDDCKKYCVNSGSMCWKCYNQQYLKLPKEKVAKKRVFNNRTAQAKDSWKDLEQTVAEDISKIPTIKEARRSRMSGALWFEKGDIVDEILMPECKERLGNISKDGAKKSFTIQKDWIDKAKAEARQNNRIMMLPFRYKGDGDTIYTVFEFEDIAELITMYKSLKYEYDILTKVKEVE